MRRLLILPVVALALGMLLLPPHAAIADEKDSTLEDELRLKNAYQNTDGASLVAFLSTRARGEASKEKLTALIEALDAKTAAERQKACTELVAIGAPAIPMLRLASRDTDSPGTVALAKRCLQVLEEEPGALSIAAIRLLVARRPAGTAGALLAYLPHAENDSVREELKGALAGVAYDKGKADDAVLKALSDEHPLRRASAITALCASGIAEPRAILRKLLSDESPSVRLRASLALAQAMDAKAVSTLVTLLVDAPIEQARECESYLIELAGDLAPKVALGNDDVSRTKCRDAWAKWWLDTEGPSLLEEVKKRTLTEDDMTNVEKLIDKLGDDSFEVRQKAEEEIKKLGTRILPLLRHALKHADLEVRKTTAKLMGAIEMDKTAPLSPVTARLIALRKPKGAVEALLAYMPFSDDESILEELQGSLNACAFATGGKAHPSILKALGDKAAARRIAAAEALINGPVVEYMPQIRKLLKDKDLQVRLKVALALANQREPEAVPTLIGLIGEMPAEGSSSAEDFLYKLARDNPPKDLPDGDDNKKKRASAWDKWWTDNQGKVAMLDRFASASREKFLGYTMLIQANNNMIVEWDKDRKTRWTLTNLMNPWDAQWLPNNRVLVAEYNGQRVTERDLKGNIVWQVSVPSWPMAAERLSNGHTFVTCRNMIVQYDRTGRQVYKLDRPHDVMTARRLPNGQIVIVTSNRQIIRLDRGGKEIKTATIPNVYYNQNEILNNGNVLVPLGWNNVIKEYTSDGKEIWSATVSQPMHAVRLPNGNTLVSSQNWPYRIFELDKKGKQVADHLTNNAYVFRVRRR